MEYVTLNFEYADRTLPSFWSLSAVLWIDGVSKQQLSRLINPDCEIEPFFIERNPAIKSIDFTVAPYFEDIWPEFCDFIQERLVFCFQGAKDIAALLLRSKFDNLVFPNICYASVASISNRIWNISAPVYSKVTDYLNIETVPCDSLQDAMILGKIIFLAMEETLSVDVNDLFSKIGFAGGVVYNMQKYNYRVSKNKEKSFEIKLKI